MLGLETGVQRQESLVFSQPVLKVRKLDGPRLNQEPCRESAHPVVMHAKSFGYVPMLPDPGFNRFPGLFDAFFDIHALTL